MTGINDYYLYFVLFVDVNWKTWVEFQKDVNAGFWKVNVLYPPMPVGNLYSPVWFINIFSFINVSINPINQLMRRKGRAFLQICLRSISFFLWNKKQHSETAHIMREIISLPFLAPNFFPLFLPSFLPSLLPLGLHAHVVRGPTESYREKNKTEEYTKHVLLFGNCPSFIAFIHAV